MPKKDKELTVYMGRDPVTRRFNRNLAIVAREAVPAELMMDYLLAILEGHGQAVIKRDATAEHGWRVTWPERGEIASTHEQKAWAWTQWRQAGYGMPSQAIQIEGELRSYVNELSTTINLNQLTPGQIRGMRELLRPQAELPAPLEPVEIVEDNEE